MKKLPALKALSRPREKTSTNSPALLSLRALLHETSDSDSVSTLLKVMIKNHEEEDGQTFMVQEVKCLRDSTEPNNRCSKCQQTQIKHLVP